MPSATVEGSFEKLHCTGKHFECYVAFPPAGSVVLGAVLVAVSTALCAAIAILLARQVR